MSISNGMWQIGGGYGYPGSLVSEPGGSMSNNSSRDLGAAIPGAWDDWTVHIVFSSTSATSLVEVWRNGQQVVSNFRPTVGTLYPNLHSYLKVGYYRSTAITQDSTVRLDNIRIGTTRTDATRTPTPTPTPMPMPVGAPLWGADYESGDLSEFEVTSWNNVPLAPQVSSTAQSGRFAGQYTIPAGARRSENVPKLGLKFREGDDLWFNVATWLDADVPLNTGEWQQLTQWKNDGVGSPPLGLTLENGQYQIGGGWGWPGTDTPSSPKLAKVSLGAATAGVWENWLIRIRFSSDPAKGTVDLWRNGTQMVNGWKPPGGTLYPNLESYWKVGYYRSANIAQQSTVRLDNLRVGTTPN